MNKKNKKGFTLIELMAVIAIIAILVSVVMPTVTSYTTKANAATNAANLRSLKSSVSTLYVQGAITYESAELHDLAIDLADLAYQEALEWLGADSVVTKMALSTKMGLVATKELRNTYYAKDGVINIDGNILTAPTAKEINLGGFKLRKGTEMTVTVDENNIICTYGGIGVETFALIAEYGDDVDPNELSNFAHTYIDSNSDGICDICNGSYAHTEQDKVTGELGNTIGGGHICSDSDDHICDDPNCGLSVADHFDSDDQGHECDKSGCTTIASDCRNMVNCVCTECGATSHVDNEGGRCGGGDGKCDNCGTSV